MSKKRLAIFIAALVLIAAGVGYVVYHFASQAARNKIYDDIKPEPVEIESTTEAVPEYHSKIDWQKMHEINPDIYAWIEIPGTDISYPVVQGGIIFISIAFSIVMLLVDLVYAFVDPRIKTQYQGEHKKRSKAGKHKTAAAAGGAQ